MKTHVMTAALVFCSSAFAGTDFFGVPATPVPAPSKGATATPAAGAPRSGAPGSAADGKEAGAELAALQDHFQQEVASATKQTRDRYVAALQSLQRTLLEKNDLPGSLAVQNELAGITGAAPTKASAGMEARPSAEFTALKQRYEQDLVAWSKPANDRYIVALQNLLHSTLQKGDVPGATKIQEELESAKAVGMSESDKKKALLVSCWWQVRDVVLEFVPDGKLIEHSENPRAWKGKSWKLSKDLKAVECTYTNGQTQSYTFKNGGLMHFDPAWGEFKKVPAK